MIYKLMPRVHIQWHDVWLGAFVTSLLFTIGKFLIGLYIGKSGVASGFGAAGSLVIVFIWVYYSAQIFLVGAEFTWVYAKTLGSQRSSEGIEEVVDKAADADQAPSRSDSLEGRHRGSCRRGRGAGATAAGGARRRRRRGRDVLRGPLSSCLACCVDSEDRDLEHQRRQPAPAAPARLARRRPSPTSSRCRSSRPPTPSFPRPRLERAGYGAVWCGQRTWNGVALLARGTKPVTSRRALPGDERDSHARYIEAAVDGVLVALDLPAQRQPAAGAEVRLQARLVRAAARARALARRQRPPGRPRRRLQRRADRRRHLRDPVVAEERAAPAGAARGVPAPARAGLDRRDPRAPSRRAHLHLLGLPAERWARDAGLRIDHLLLSESVQPRLRSAGVDRDVRGRENASDHAPVWIELA